MPKDSSPAKKKSLHEVPPNLILKFFPHLAIFSNFSAYI